MTVTVESLEDSERVLLPEAEIEPVVLMEPLLDEEPEGGGEGGGVVRSDWVPLPVDPTTGVPEALVTVTAPSVKDTTVSDDTAGMTVARVVFVPSPTLTWTTLVVTVTAALGII